MPKSVTKKNPNEGKVIERDGKKYRYWGNDNPILEWDIYSSPPLTRDKRYIAFGSAYDITALTFPIRVTLQYTS